MPHAAVRARTQAQKQRPHDELTPLRMMTVRTAEGCCEAGERVSPEAILTTRSDASVGRCTSVGSTAMRSEGENPNTPLASRKVPHAQMNPASVSATVWLSPAQSRRAHQEPSMHSHNRYRGSIEAAAQSAHPGLSETAHERRESMQGYQYAGLIPGVRGV